MIEREVQLDVMKTRDVQKTRNSEVEAVLRHIKKGPNKILIVYIDHKTNLKYISNAAAYAIGFISYEAFCSNDKGYYLITDLLLDLLKRKHKIEYVDWNKDINNSIPNFYSESNGFLDDQKYNDTNNVIDEEFKDINDLKELRSELLEANKNILNTDSKYNDVNNIDTLITRNK